MFDTGDFIKGLLRNYVYLARAHRERLKTNMVNERMIAKRRPWSPWILKWYCAILHTKYIKWMIQREAVINGRSESLLLFIWRTTDQSRQVFVVEGTHGRRITRSTELTWELEDRRKEIWVEASAKYISSCSHASNRNA